MATACETQLQEVWRSSRGSISVHTEKKKPSSGFSGGSKQIIKRGLEEEEYGVWVREMMRRYHSHSCVNEGKQFTMCSSAVVQRVKAPVSVVWSLVRRFDEPHLYKQFVRSCCISGGGDQKVKVGCLREVQVVSGLPAATSTERLDILDEERHILSFSIVGGDHRLSNYRSITSLHERLMNGEPETIVIESYAVDVPHGNTKEDTRLFINTIVKCNLQSLADVSKHTFTCQRTSSVQTAAYSLADAV